MTVFKKSALIGLLLVLAFGGTAQAQQIKSILFVGNSYTYYNDMPKMVGELLASDAGNPVHYTVDAATIGGKTLEVLWADRQIQQKFASRKWDDVVLQEQSEWALFPAQVEKTAVSVATWTKAIRMFGGKPFIYGTWARQPGSYWYTESQYAPASHDPKYMLGQLDANGTQLAQQSGAGFVAVGDAFAAALKQDPQAPLYASDSSHPSPAGSYLAALMFYQAISGRSASNTSYVPPGVTAVTAESFRALAAQMGPK